MSYTASLLQLGGGVWVGDDVDLSDVDDFDVLIDLVRELGDGANTRLLFLEEDDEYLAIVRIDGEQEPATFVSDRRVLDDTGLAGRIFGDELATSDDESEEESVRPEVEPAGQLDLLADLGVSEELLVQLCAEKGMLPADVIFEICERIGCGSVLEELRGV